MNVLGDPFWISTLAIAIIGWVIAFIGSVFNNVYYGVLFPKFGWWVLTFQLLTILLTTHAALSNTAERYHRLLIGAVVIGLVYTSNLANMFVWSSTWSSGMVAAGYILLAIVNFVWLLQLSTDDENPVHRTIASLAATKE